MAVTICLRNHATKRNFNCALEAEGAKNGVCCSDNGLGVREIPGRKASCDYSVDRAVVSVGEGICVLVLVTFIVGQEVP